MRGKFKLALLALATSGIFFTLQGCQTPNVFANVNHSYIQRERSFNLTHYYRNNHINNFNKIKRIKRVHTNSQRANTSWTNKIRYHYKTSHYRLRKLRMNQPIYNKPYEPGMTPIAYSRQRTLVHLNQEAYARHNVPYYSVSNERKTLGWVRMDELRSVKKYELPFIYSSQFWPSPARDACEAAALKMALSSLGVAQHLSLHKMVKQMPRSNNPERGYTANPFKYGTGASIYPKALARFARRRFGVHAKSITGAKKHTLERYVMHGNPVVFEGSYMMRNTTSDHSLVLIGYKPHYFKFADPFSKKNGKTRIGWVSTKMFMHIFNTSYRGSRAMVTFYR